MLEMPAADDPALLIRMNEEVIRDWVKEYDRLDEEIEFLESCVRRLPSYLAEVINELMVKKVSWDEAEQIIGVCRKTIANRRKKAIQLITLDFQRRASEMEAIMLA